MDTDMNISKCMAFVEAVDSGSFTAAAERLSYSQSGISRMIADLETEWGTTLLERGRSGVRLTSEGSALLPFAHDLVGAYDKLQEEVDALHGLESGVIRIGTFSSVATHWIPEVVGRFQKDYPGIDYELLMGDYTEIESWVAEGRVDCGFCRLPAPSGLDASLLEEDELVAVLPEDHPLTRQSSVSLEDLCGSPFMMLGRGDNTEIADIFTSAGLRPDVRYTTWDDFSIMAMVESSMGVAILHSLVLRRTPYHIVIRPLARPLYRKIGIATRRGKHVSLATSRFLDYLSRYLEDDKTFR